MGWREYKHLYVKYEGDIGLATPREIEHADRGMDPETARRIALSGYERKKRELKNENNKNTQNEERSTEDADGDKRFAESLF